jgi:hypothetical protein
MGESRGKRAKKASDWKLHLGLKELIFGGLGVAGLVMMSFALGTLAGRGDIYRVMHNWGLLGPDNSKTGQIWYQAPPPPPTQVVTLASPPAQEPEAPLPAAKPAPHQTSATERGLPPAPTQGSVAAVPNPVQSPGQARKKSAKAESKGKEDKLEKIRQEVASKLKFQNSLDLSTTRASHPADKVKKGSDKEPAAAAGAQATPMVVAKYRDAGQAKARLAQMQKQGDKVVLKEGKDSEGQYFAICRQAHATPKETPKAAPNQLKKVKTDSKPANKTAASH